MAQSTPPAARLVIGVLALLRCRGARALAHPQLTRAHVAGHPVRPIAALAHVAPHGPVGVYEVFPVYGLGDNPYCAKVWPAALAASARLGAAAAALLGAPRVRLYQTAVFTKRPGDAATQWHSDLHTSPLDANGMVTCWLALHAVPSPDDGGSALVFAARSHRDLALAMYAVADEGERPDARYCYGAERYDGAIAHHGALAAGDATWHHGWCLHSASALAGGARDARVALALTYVEDGARTLDAAGLAMIEDEDAPSYAGWLAECEPGAPIDHPLLPLVPTE